MRYLLLPALLMLTACNRNQGETIEPVPEQTAESANRLMSEAESAAGNAQDRMSALPQANNSVENSQ